MDRELPRCRAITVVRLVVSIIIAAVALGGCGIRRPPATAYAPTVVIGGAPVPTAATPATSPGDAPAEDQGITFGAPVRLPGQVSFVAVPVTNTGGLVRSFTVRATYERAGAVVAEASGSVNDLLPGQRRAVSLAAGAALPDDLAPRLAVVTMRADPSTPGSTAAARLVFGTPLVAGGAASSVSVTVTNTGTGDRGLTVQVAYYRGGVLVGLGTNAVLGIAPGATATVTIGVQGSLDGEPEVAMETLVQ